MQLLQTKLEGRAVTSGTVNPYQHSVTQFINMVVGAFLRSVETALWPRNAKWANSDMVALDLVSATVATPVGG